MITHLVRDEVSGKLWLGLRGTGLVSYDPATEALDILGVGLDPAVDWQPWMGERGPTGTLDGVRFEGDHLVVEQGGLRYSVRP